MSPRILVWLAYLSIVLAMVWGVPGLLLSGFVLRKTKSMHYNLTDKKLRRDVRGARVIAYIGCTVSAIVILLIIWSWVTT